MEREREISKINRRHKRRKTITKTKTTLKTSAEMIYCNTLFLKTPIVNRARHTSKHFFHNKSDRAPAINTVIYDNLKYLICAWKCGQIDFAPTSYSWSQRTADTYNLLLGRVKVTRVVLTPVHRLYTSQTKPAVSNISKYNQARFYVKGLIKNTNKPWGGTAERSRAMCGSRVNKIIKKERSQ